MNSVVKTNIFKTGNSVAVRLPKDFGFDAGEDVELIRHGRSVEIRPVVDPEKERAKVQELVRQLNQLGPVDKVKRREPIEFPARHGLY